MSSRVLKKLQGGDKDLELQKNGIDDEDQLSDDEEELEVVRGKSKHLNPFDLVSSYMKITIERK